MLPGGKQVNLRANGWKTSLEPSNPCFESQPPKASSTTPCRVSGLACFSR